MRSMPSISSIRRVRGTATSSTHDAAAQREQVGREVLQRRVGQAAAASRASASAAFDAMYTSERQGRAAHRGDAGQVVGGAGCRSRPRR